MYLPTFTISNKTLRSVGLIEAAKEVIENAPLIPAWEATFRKEALLRTVHHGTHIEGNALNLTEAGKVVAIADGSPVGMHAEKIGQEAGVVARDRDIQEVINYRAVLSFIEKFQKRAIRRDATSMELWGDNEQTIEESHGKITEEVLLHMHKLTVQHILPEHECGVFRKSQVVVKNSKTGEITFRPPPSVEVPFLVADFLEWVAGTTDEMLHPVLKAGVLHYELVRIHPFVDGNGRVSRATALLSLFLSGYDVKKFFSLEEYYDKDPMEYYLHLQEVEREKGNLTSWLEYFSEGIAIELTRVKDKIKKLSRDIKFKHDLGGGQIALTERQLKIVEYIQSKGYIQNQVFFEVIPMVSDDTILRDLKDLMKKGIIEKKGSTKGAKYVLKK